MWFLILICAAFPLLSNGEQNLTLKKLGEPCSIIYTQVHCEDDEEDYEDTALLPEECDPIKTDNCDRSFQLFCYSDFCAPSCHPTKEEYDETTGKCFRKIGADCKSSEECDKNAICERKHCRCAQNHTKIPETGKCVKSAAFGQHCDSEIACDVIADMACNDNVCECRSPETQFYHTKRKRCYLRVAQDCSNKDPQNAFQFCPDNSDCVRKREGNHSIEEDDEIETTYTENWNINDVGEGEMYRCTCNHGFAPTTDEKQCLGLHKTKCNSLHKCNTERSLKCYNSTNMCQCVRPKDQVYNPHHQRCVTLIGSLCTEGQDSCIEWGECKPDVDKQVSTCKCLSGYSAAFENEVCLKDHGSNCSILGEPHCNTFLGLECSIYTGTCQCSASEQFYDVKLKTCRDFQVVPRQPATHYDTSDREYMFHLKNYAQTKKMENYFLKVLGILTFIFI